MRIFLDRCVPRKIEPLLTGHEIVHARAVPWGELRNGALVRRVSEEGFDVLLTVDANMRYQTPLPLGGVAAVVILIYDNRLDALRPHIPAILAALPETVRGVYTELNFRESQKRL